MRVLITGGRDYQDSFTVNKTLNAVHKKYGVSCIIQGGATGADTLAKEWAINSGIEFEDHPAEWKNLDVTPCLLKTGKYGKYNALAGTNRNSYMLEKRFPDILVAFPGGNGTNDMVLKAKKAELPVLQVKNAVFPDIPF